MGIATTISKMCKQTAVYWGNPVNDGYSAYTYDAPVEIKCRWQETLQALSKDDEAPVISRAVVFVLQDVDEEGLLWLGELADLSVGDLADPKAIEGVYSIKRFTKSPAVGSTTEFLRKANLSPFLF